MARRGGCDFSQLKELQDKLNYLHGGDFNKFCESVAKELASRLLRKVIKRTITGVYPKSSGKVGGNLRRGWTGGKQVNAKNYADSLPIMKKGDVFEVEIINPVHYASYVEYGHRTRNHKGWVKGQFMLTISEKELETQAPKIIESKLIRFLAENLQK